MTASATGFTDAELTALRQDFPILSRLGRGGQPVVYLDTAATAQKPRSVIAAEGDFLSQSNAAIHRGTHLLGDEATQAFEDARLTIADFIGAQSDEIIWTKNATEALNLIAYSIGNASLGRGSVGGVTPSASAQASLTVGPGDRIVTTRAEHHANLVPWQELCARTGAELAWLELTEDGRIDVDTLSVITPNTKLVAFTHISNVTGAISPISAIVNAARNVGALIVLDTCQSSAHMPLNVSDLGVDFIVMSAHKMMGPTGVGALWGRRELLHAMPPVMMGGSMIAWVTMEGAEYMPPPERFEAGTQPVAQIAAWARAIEYLQNLDMRRIAAHEETMTSYLLDGIASVRGVRLLGPSSAQERIGLAAFVVEGVHPHDVGQVMDAEDVAVRTGHHCAIPLHTHFGVRSSTRASLAPYTTHADIDRFVHALERVRSYFGGAHV